MSAAAQLISTSNAANVVVSSNSNNINNNNSNTTNNNNPNQTLNYTDTAPSAIPTAKRPLTVISESTNPTDNNGNSNNNNNNSSQSNNNNVNSNNIVPSVTLNRVSCFLFLFNKD